MKNEAVIGLLLTIPMWLVLFGFLTYGYFEDRKNQKEYKNRRNQERYELLLLEVVNTPNRQYENKSNLNICEYCGVKNNNKKHHCVSCGAPL
jgi:hypothetical protein